MLIFSAAIPDVVTGGYCPPTAQFALRQGKRLAQNVAAVLDGRKAEPFKFKTLGVLASRAVLTVPTISALLAPAYAPSVFVRALLVGVVVALTGALYPAIRAVRLSPMEALRYE